MEKQRSPWGTAGYSSRRGRAGHGSSERGVPGQFFRAGGWRVWGGGGGAPSLTFASSPGGRAMVARAFRLWRASSPFFSSLPPGGRTKRPGSVRAPSGRKINKQGASQPGVETPGNHRAPSGRGVGPSPTPGRRAPTPGRLARTPGRLARAFLASLFVTKVARCADQGDSRRRALRHRAVSGPISEGLTVNFGRLSEGGGYLRWRAARGSGWKRAPQAMPATPRRNRPSMGGGCRR